MQPTGLPQFLKNSPTVICDQVLFLVKNSNLNFNVHETPYSLDINIKKRFANKWGNAEDQTMNDLLEPVQIQTTPSVKLEEYLLMENKCKIALSKVETLEADLKQYKSDLQTAKNELKTVKNDKKLLENKHIKTCEDSKNIKEERDAIVKEKNALSVALKNQKKVNQEQVTKFEKENSGYSKTIENLNKFKDKVEEEARDTKKKNKKLLQKKKKDALKQLQDESNCEFSEDKKEFIEIKEEVEPARKILVPARSKSISLVDENQPLTMKTESTQAKSEPAELTMTTNTCTTTSVANAPASEDSLKPIMMSDEEFFQKYLKPLQDKFDQQQKAFSET